MKYQIKPTKAFEKNLKKLTATEQRLVAKKLMLMMENP
jgi:mRNA-degrading endonuclease RelE of RelBE toxin-antitoxin system